MDPAAISALYQKYLGRAATDADLQAMANNPGGIQGVQQAILSSPEYQQSVSSLYQKYLGRDATPADLQSQAQNPDGLSGIEKDIQSSPEYTSKQSSTGGGTTTGGGGSTGGGGGAATGSGNPLLNPFTQPFQAPAPVSVAGSPTPGTPWIPPTPTLNTPSYTPPPAYKAPNPYADYKLPSYQDVLANDPGIAFRASQQEQSLQANQAAKGVLASGGALKDLINYSGQQASNEYGAAANRSLGAYQANAGTYQMNANVGQQAYGTNLASQYTQPYQYAYQGALDQFNPQMTAYQTQANAGQQTNQQNQQNAFNVWGQNFNIANTNGNNYWSRLYQATTAQ